jgi:hypothetical protein
MHEINTKVFGCWYGQERTEASKESFKKFMLLDVEHCQFGYKHLQDNVTLQFSSGGWVTKIWKREGPIKTRNRTAGNQRRTFLDNSGAPKLQQWRVTTYKQVLLTPKSTYSLNNIFYTQTEISIFWRMTSFCATLYSARPPGRRIHTALITHSDISSLAMRRR